MLKKGKIEEFLAAGDEYYNLAYYSLWDEEPYIQKAWSILKYNDGLRTMFPDCDDKVYRIHTFFQDDTMEYPIQVNQDFFNADAVSTADEILGIFSKGNERFKKVVRKMIGRIMNRLAKDGVTAGNIEGYSKSFTKAWRGGDINFDGDFFGLRWMRSFFYNRCLDMLAEGNEEK